MTGSFVRVVARVPLAQAEEARAAALDVVPAGFEESETGDTFTLALYVDECAVEPIKAVFSDVDVVPVEPGWEDAWRVFHKPVRVGGLWIGPPWEQPDARERAVVIDPGRAFGTGAHPTTRLCVELLARSERGSLLDVGCGSGVLSLAAARLGFGPIRAVDNDPVAVETTLVNAAANGVAIDVGLLDGEVDALPVTAITVANVLLEPVERILSRLDGGVVITSGYLESDHPVAPGWHSTDRVTLDGWAADRFERSTLGAVSERSIGNPVGEMAQPLPGPSTAATGLRGKQA
jgi:ribosomal protein L11 methyltransferase